jgi:hypothetical protein
LAERLIINLHVGIGPTSDATSPTRNNAGETGAVPIPEPQRIRSDAHTCELTADKIVDKRVPPSRWRTIMQDRRYLGIAALALLATLSPPATAAETHNSATPGVAARPQGESHQRLDLSSAQQQQLAHALAEERAQFAAGWV